MLFWRVKRLFRFKYPKITILIICILAAYYIFRDPSVQSYLSGLENFSYLGIFIAGFFFSFGFTTPFSIGFFLVSNPENILLAALIGGFGALIADFIIYKLIRLSFM